MANQSAISRRNDPHPRTGWSDRRYSCQEIGSAIGFPVIDVADLAVDGQDGETGEDTILISNQRLSSEPMKSLAFNGFRLHSCNR